MLPEANTRRQEGKYPTIKVLQGCILKLLLHSVNSVAILYRTGNMQSVILLSFIASSSLPPCGLQSTHPQMPCYISPYVVYNVYGCHSLINKIVTAWFHDTWSSSGFYIYHRYSITPSDILIFFQIFWEFSKLLQNLNKYEGQSKSNLHIFGACENGNNAQKHSQPVISRLKQSFVILHCVYREL